MEERSNWHFSKSNRRGVILLLVVLVVIVFTPRILMSFNRDKITFDQELVDQAKQLKSEYALNNKYPKYSHRKKSKYRIPPKSFNPNSYSEKDWMNLGLSIKQAKVVMKFTERGVYSNEDVQRIFVIPPQLYDLIKDSLVFSKRFEAAEKQPYANFEKKIQSVELNTASKQDLIDLPGIGEYLADKIISYRERLGGFIQKEQLLEIKKIDIELYSKLEQHLIIDAGIIIKMNINLSDAEVFKSHPYMNWNIANSIVKMRIQIGRAHV